MNRLQLEDETEHRKHLQSIEDLVRIFNVPRDYIVTVYERELNLISRLARVRDYLPILVSRRVKNLLLG